jgi:hypothetical protein
MAPEAEEDWSKRAMAMTTTGIAAVSMRTRCMLSALDARTFSS